MHCCDSLNCMSKSKGRARLIAVCSREEVASFDQHQIPIHIDEHLLMKLQIDDSCLTCHEQQINKQSRAYRTFSQTYQKLTEDERRTVFSVPISQIKGYIPRCVPCLGCRTSMDHFLKAIREYRHQAFEPIRIDENDRLILEESYRSSPDYIYSLFYIHGSKFKSLLESIPKSKKNRRCHIHSLDKTKSIQDWQFVWDLMNNECRDEMTLVESDELLDALENYLHKHRFCSKCKLKVLEAYDLLLEPNQRERKGFCPGLYEGLRSCSHDKHIHIQAEKDFLASLISRAAAEMEDSRRERHAKTLDIAQEEILICLGIYLYERFEKIYRTIRSEEQTWQLLVYVIIDCFQIDEWKNFCEELSANEVPKKAKRMKKKPPRPMKINEETPIRIVEENELILRDRRDSSPLKSCTSLSSQSLMKSQSCPILILSPIEQKIHSSSSLETLFSSISTRDWLGQERILHKPSCLTLACVRCSSTRTDLGYSSELDDASSSGPGDYSSTTCVACLTDQHCDCARTIELCDSTRKPKLKLQLSDQYPFFTMDLKQTWDETLPTILEPTSFISDDDLRQFFLLHTQFETKRAQLREHFKLKFEQLISRSENLLSTDE